MATRDADVEAALHVLRAPALGGRVRPFVQGDRVDWLGLLAESDSMSTTQRLLVRAAYDLWSGQVNVGLAEVARRLDSVSFGRVLAALSISHGRGDEPRRASLRLVPGSDSAA